MVIVDDMPDFRLLVRTALQLRGGFEVVGEAADGNSAVTAAEHHRPDVVVLDLGLPDLAGEDVITRLRLVAPDAKVVVFTGLDLTDVDSVRSTVAGVVRKGDIGYLVDVVEEVIGRAARTAVRVFPALLDSAHRAREFVEDRCRQWAIQDVVDDVLLVVSELVTNAITHARSACELRLVLTTSALRVEVGDGGDGSPDPLLAHDDDEHGRGLYLVAALSQAWGVDSDASGGKVVWAEVPITAPA